MYLKNIPETQLTHNVDAGEARRTVFKITKLVIDVVKNSSMTLLKCRLRKSHSI